MKINDVQLPGERSMPPYLLQYPALPVKKDYFNVGPCIVHFLSDLHNAVAKLITIKKSIET